MKEIIYLAQEQRIDLSKVTRVYPAAVVNAAGEKAQVSLEWAELKQDIVPVSHYELVFDFDPVGDEIRNRTVLVYESKTALIAAMSEVAALFEKR